jgi:hypothetical protein
MSKNGRSRVASKSSNIDALLSAKQYLPFLTYVFYIFPFLIISDDFIKLLAGALISLVGFVLTTFLSVKSFKKEQKKIKAEVKKEAEVIQKAVRKTLRITLFFGMIYVFVAAFAITRSIEAFSDEMKSILSQDMANLDLKAVLLLLSFFVTAVAFFHAGITFLATDALEYLTEGEPSMVFPNFVLLFFEAVLIFFMAVNLDNTANFLKLIIALLVTDIVWIIIYIRHREVVLIEWLHMNVLTTMFLIVALPTSNTIVTDILIFVILASRTICDYVFGWPRIYNKHPVVNVHLPG